MSTQATQTTAHREVVDRGSGALDAARVIWAVGIVHFHVSDSFTTVSYSALPSFLIVSLALTARSSHRRSWRQFLVLRSERLLLPWITWSALYALMAVASAIVGEGGSPFAWMNARMVLYGTKIHLWFLPAVFLLGILAKATGELSETRSRLVKAAGLVGAGVWMGVLFTKSDQWLVPGPQYVFAVVSLPIALAVGDVLVRVRAVEQMAWRLAGAIMLAGVMLIVPSSDALAYAIGYAGVLVACSLRAPRFRRLQRLAGITLFVYLAHPAIANLIMWKSSLEGDMLSLVTIVLSFAAGLVGMKLLEASTRIFSRRRVVIISSVLGISLVDDGTRPEREASGP